MYPSYFETHRDAFMHFIKNALEEDIQSGDETSLSCIDEDAKNSAQLIVKEDCILAGVELAQAIFEYYDPSLNFTTHISDGTAVKKGAIAFTVAGSSRALLSTERVVLNCMQRMSGIASLTHAYTQMIAHTSCTLLDTRKTTPNFRYPEKWAVAIGGGKNHRIGLFDALMIKDNHVDYCGGMTRALERTTTYLRQQKKDLEVIVEVRNEKELLEALPFACVSRILLDNHQPETLQKAVQLIAGRKPTEASGNITAANLVAMAETGVDYISLGALTHSAKNIDLSLKATISNT
ncbi:MAG: carboxylating nicotinate-nucleotide diphosphorylase [Flavobacteriaceae bacterium]|mgnify:FL=1|jgi:nicotinate-nucleotide pyrophosphorylase (carboxylating)|nr:carboxylating nicotinate-nucleotide diphosphorylase [Flavobacteriaceae bacterium]